MGCTDRAFRALALLSIAFFTLPASADPGDEKCFPLYRATGAVPGTPNCPTTASTANVNLGTLSCTATFGSTQSIPRYCGTVPKDFGRCISTPYPISIATANKFLAETDMRDEAGGLLAFTRYYNSTPAAAQGRMLGLSWRSSFEASVTTTASGASVTRPDGRIIYFTQAANIYTPDSDVNDRLTRLPVTGTLTGWRFSDAARQIVESYDATGRLTQITRIAGRTLVLTYSTAATPASIAPGAGYLIGVTDDFGRTLNFIYSSTSKRVTSVVAPDGVSLTMGYDSSNVNLTAVTYPDTHTKRYFYNEAAFTAGQSQPYAVTGIADESGARVINYAYDAHGRAFDEQQLPGASVIANEYQLAYDSFIGFDAGSGRTISTGQSTLTDPLGGKFVYSFSTVVGVARLTGVSQPGGAGCLASNSALAYDANGNVTREDDFNLNRRCYAYDTTRNLRTTTLEGLPASKACPTTLAAYVPSPADTTHPERKTTTVWHPDWTLKVREAEPKRITTWVYNGQSDPISGGTANCVSPVTTLPDGKPLAVLCTRYEQATTDATGALGMSATVTGATRAWSYTYNQYGQVLTETTPKQSPTDVLSHTTTYVYYPTTGFAGAVGHTMGDLNTVTNPLSQATTFMSYDKAGRLLSSMDANSTVTSMTYWPRGWLRTQTVTPASGVALMTTYDYWPTGLLKTVTLADTSTLNYAYDNAHRLTDVTDTVGNKVHYVLDNIGNRTSEQVSDASGQLANTISWVYDQLSRVQSTTGTALH